MRSSTIAVVLRVVLLLVALVASVSTQEAKPAPEPTAAASEALLKPTDDAVTVYRQSKRILELETANAQLRMRSSQLELMILDLSKERLASDREAIEQKLKSDPSDVVDWSNDLPVVIKKK